MCAQSLFGNPESDPRTRERQGGGTAEQFPSASQGRPIVTSRLNVSNQEGRMEELPLPIDFQSERGGHGTPSLVDIVAFPNHQWCADASTFGLGSKKDGFNSHS